MWNPGRESWRYQITAGQGLAPHASPTQHTFTFSDGMGRRHNAFFESAMQASAGPTDAAAGSVSGSN